MDIATFPFGRASPVYVEIGTQIPMNLEPMPWNDDTGQHNYDTSILAWESCLG